MSDVVGLVQSVGVLYDLIKANRSLRNFNELVAAVAEVNIELVAAHTALLACQKEQLTLSKRVGELEQEAVKLKNWDRERERYQLTEITTGVFAYGLKPGMETSEPSHHLCANCFAKYEKAILQIDHTLGGESLIRCLRCDTTLIMR